MSISVDLPWALTPEILNWADLDRPERAELKAIIGDCASMTARDVLRLDIPDRLKLRIALRDELIPAAILHEFALACAEDAVRLMRERGREPHELTTAALTAKRAWLRGEIPNHELTKARNFAKVPCYTLESAAHAAYHATDRCAWSAAQWSAGHAIGADEDEAMTIARQVATLRVMLDGPLLGSLAFPSPA